MLKRCGSSCCSTTRRPVPSIRATWRPTELTRVTAGHLRITPLSNNYIRNGYETFTLRHLDHPTVNLAGSLELRTINETSPRFLYLGTVNIELQMQRRPPSSARLTRQCQPTGPCAASSTDLDPVLAGVAPVHHPQLQVQRDAVRPLDVGVKERAPAAAVQRGALDFGPSFGPVGPVHVAAHRVHSDGTRLVQLLGDQHLGRGGVRTLVLSAGFQQTLYQRERQDSLEIGDWEGRANILIVL